MKKLFFQKSNTKLATLIIFFIVIGGFLFFGGAKDAKADGTCHYRKKTGEYVDVSAKDKTDCQTIINNDPNSASLNSAGVYNYYFDSLSPTQLQNITASDTSTKTGLPTVSTSASSPNSGQVMGLDDSCWTISEPIGSIFVCILLGVLKFCGFLLSMAAVVFGWCVNVGNMNQIINGPAIYLCWTTIRDLLNISFILVLLYSAFTIIFQVDKTNKKVILTVVLMALLVNFSFPITRFIIDMSNSLMYTIINTLNFGGEHALNEIAAKTGIESLVDPKDHSIATLLASIVFVFIMALTFLATGLLFIVRMIALAILIIFSPVAFVATILPGTSSYANKWWSNLFNYALFGPVMMLMIYITTKMMVDFAKIGESFTKLSATETIEPNLIGSMAYMSIPVVLLWIGMGTAQSMSIAGAGAIMGQAQKVGKWAGMKFSGARFATDTYKAYRARRDQAKEDSWSRKLGTFAGSQQDRLREKYLPGGKDAKLRYEKDIMSRIKKEEERADTKNMNESEARALIATGNKYQQAAGHNRLAELEVATGADLDAMRIAFGENGQATRQMTNKIRAYDPLSAFTNAAGTTDWANMEQFARSNQFDFKKIKNNSLGNAQFMGMLFDNDLVDNKKIEDIRNNANAGVLQTSLTALAASRMATTAQNRNIHMAAFAQTGNYTNTGNAAADNTFIEHLVSNMDKDNSKRTSIGFVNDARVQAHMSDSLRPNRVKQIIQNINNNVAQKGMLDYLRDDTRNVGSMGNPNASQLHHITNNDNDLQNIA